MSRIVNESVGKFTQHYPRLAAIVTVQAGGRMNAMAAAWHSPLSFKPPLFGVSIAPNRHTYALISEVKEFGMNFLPYEEAELAAAVGGSSGKRVDKFQRFNIAVNKPAKTSVPILQVAYAAYECRLVDDRLYGDHRWLVGEVMAVHLLKEAFTADEVVDLSNVSPALYMGNDFYAAVSGRMGRRLERGIYGKR